jgi:YidC/Oxa1 family membrane protein insertase
VSPYALLDPAVRIAYSFVTATASVLPLPPGPAVVVGVVLMTLLARAAMVPLALRGVRAENARRALAPQITRLRARHRGDPARLAEEITSAYRDAGTSPIAGIGPALLQLPVLSTVYRVVVVPTIGGHPNAIVAANMWGIPLSAHWPQVLSVAGILSVPGLVFVAFVAALAGLAWFSSRQVAARATASAATTGGDLAPARASVGRLIRLAPFGTVVFGVVSPLLVGTYLVVTTAWTLAERALLPRFA